MPGAFTFYKGEKISLLESEIEESNQVYHPYFFGRIVTIKDDSSIQIITKNDYLIVRRVKDGEYIGTPSKIIRMNSNAVFHTPQDIIEKSKTQFISSLKMKPPLS